MLRVQGSREKYAKTGYELYLLLGCFDLFIFI